MSDGITVLSLFDGISCGRIALERAGIKVRTYYASEIDKHAIKVSQHNWHDVVQIGDVTNVTFKDGTLYTENGDFFVGKIDLLIGGSPCQGFSLAGKQLAFDDERSRLYFEYERLLKETGASYFLLENVKMKEVHKQVITDRLGVEPIFINSSLVSAQNRQRWYWTNIPDVVVPLDKGICLKDIVVTPDRTVRGAALRGRYDKSGDRKENVGFRSDEKANALTASNVKLSLIAVADNLSDFEQPASFKVFTKNPRKPKPNQDKSGCLTGGANSGGNHSDMDVLVFSGADIPLNGSGRIDLFKSPFVRRYTPEECEMLQTVPTGYTACVSDSQRYKALGNGWTVDVIAHIFQNLKQQQIKEAA